MTARCRKCSLKRRIVAKGVCYGCYLKTRSVIPCRLEGCETDRRAHGLCQKHYLQARRRGEYIFRTCECGNPANAGVRCHNCYMRAHRRGDLQKECSTRFCPNKALARGHCGPCLGYVDAQPIKELIQVRAAELDVTELVYARDHLKMNVHFYSRDYWTPWLADRVLTEMGVWAGEYVG